MNRAEMRKALRDVGELTRSDVHGWVAAGLNEEASRLRGRARKSRLRAELLDKQESPYAVGCRETAAVFERCAALLEQRALYHKSQRAKERAQQP